MKKVLFYKKLYILLTFVMWVSVGHAQFYSVGVDPVSIKWNQIKSERGKVIFPNYYNTKGLIVNEYLKTLTPYISYNLSPNISKFDVILHTKNIVSNGMVAWAPKRMELYTPPSAGQYSMPWLKQLIAHEYRHVVQMSSLDVGFTRVFRYAFGEQFVGLVSAILPIWFLEGDATLAETQLAMNGRGNQPSFSIGLRAILNENKVITSRHYDKWKLGSYKEYTPSVYEFGYFMSDATYRYFGDQYWEKILRYVGRNPYFIVSDYFASKKYYGTSSGRVFKRTLKELRLFWHEQSQMVNSATFLDIPLLSYSTYSSPQYVGGSSVISFKRSLDELKQLVMYDKHTNDEIRLKYTPFANNKFIISDSTVYWNEHKPSLLWEQSVVSVVKKAQLYTKNGKIRLTRPKTIFKSDNCDFITPISQGRYALVDYNLQNNPSVKIYSSRFENLETYEFKGDDNTFNGLAFDEKTSKLCYIIITNNGAELGAIDINSGEKELLCGPTYIALTDLSAKNGKIYFGSTESGKDEVNVIDLESKKQYQLTTSQYGSFAGVAKDDSVAIVTSYTSNGYLLAEQKFDLDTLRVVDSEKKMPLNGVTVPIKKWDIPKLDTINVTALSVKGETKRVKRYNKTAHLFGVHSWYPAVVNYTKLIDDLQLDLGVGVTAVMQNSLSSLSGMVGYGYVPKNNSSLVMAQLNYNALPVHIGLGLDYGGTTQEIYAPSRDVIYNGDYKKYLNVKLNFSLPMNFSGNASYRTLEPYANFSFLNSKMLDDKGDVAFKGIAKMRYGLSFTSYKPLAVKDVAPRLGYSLLVGGLVNPVRGDFGSIVNLYARGYLPGFFRHHAFSLALGYQKQFSSTYNFSQKFLHPRGNDLLGATNHSISLFANYKLPITNCDLIIPSVIDIKRIYLDIFGEYANCDYVSPKLKSSKSVYSAGGELLFDFHVLGMSTFKLTAGVSVYKASQSNKPCVGFSFKYNY